MRARTGYVFGLWVERVRGLFALSASAGVVCHSRQSFRRVRRSTRDREQKLRVAIVRNSFETDRVSRGRRRL